MAITTLSNNVIDQRKEETLQAQNLRKIVPFRDINLIDTESIEYQGQRIGITKQAFKGLLGLIGMSQSFAKKFDNLFTPEAKAQFINTMKNAMSSNYGKLNEVTIILNPVHKKIIGITKGTQQSISNSQFLGITENLIDKHGFDVTNWSTDPATGIVRINAFNPKAEFAVKGLSDEVFTGGVSFSNSPLKGFQVMPYVNRMWCANGLTTSLASESYTLNSLDNVSMEKFQENLQELRSNNFAPSGFGDRVRAAHNTHASVNEMQWAHNQIAKHAGERADQWIPLQENLNAYNKMDITNMDSNQMKGAKTNQSVWSVMNGLTHFATHGRDLIQSSMQDADSTQMMVQAGNFFGKKNFDHENHMPNPFGNLDLGNQHGAMLN
jgi:hypothetical protein